MSETQPRPGLADKPRTPKTYDELAQQNRQLYRLQLAQAETATPAVVQHRAQAMEAACDRFMRYARGSASPEVAYQGLENLVQPILHSALTPDVRLWLLERLERLPPEDLFRFMFGAREANAPLTAEHRTWEAAIAYRGRSHEAETDAEIRKAAYDVVYLARREAGHPHARAKRAASAALRKRVEDEAWQAAYDAYRGPGSYAKDAAATESRDSTYKTVAEKRTHGFRPAVMRKVRELEALEAAQMKEWQSRNGNKST